MEKTAEPSDRSRQTRGGCDTCKWCGVLLAGGGAAKEVIMLCRRKPPTVAAAVIGVGNTPNGPVPQWNQWTSWPQVSKTDWCGEHEPEFTN